jgi:hypothetical protein
MWARVRRHTPQPSPAHALTPLPPADNDRCGPAPCSSNHGYAGTRACSYRDLADPHAGHTGARDGGRRELALAWPEIPYEPPHSRGSTTQPKTRPPSSTAWPRPRSGARAPLYLVDKPPLPPLAAARIKLLLFDVSSLPSQTSTPTTTMTRLL